jgi:hypothetical protein
MAYETERGDPQTDQCATTYNDGVSNMSLLFDGYYLKMLVTDQVDTAWIARSGLPDENGWFNYTVAAQQISNTGPIPAGSFWVQVDQLSPVYNFLDSWGNYRLTIHYFATTVTYGRGGFFIHGGKTFGSKGCIDLAQYIDSFAQKLSSLFQSEVANKEGGGMIPGLSNCYLPLNVQYAADYVAMP